MGNPACSAFTESSGDSHLSVPQSICATNHLCHKPGAVQVELGIGPKRMEKLNGVVARPPRDNDSQAEQSVAVADVAARLGIKLEIIYADNDAVNQTQQLIKI